MKNFVRILFSAMLIVVICQTNANSQGIKGLLNKTKSAIAPKAKVPSKDKESSSGPAKPVAPEVKNSVSELRSYTGLTKDAFMAKMKSQGYVQVDDEIGMGGTCYKSKLTGYLLSAEFGTRGKAEYVRSASKALVNKNPNLGAVKKTFLDLGTQCSNLKANSEGGWIKANDRKGTNKNFKNAEDRTSKFLPAFENMISTKEDGGAVDKYSEKDYEYILTYRFAKVMGSTIIVQVTDLTIESQFG
ncbi:MAG: hypothetical protein WCK18_04470 [Prolixibacteraceae bacterium]